jgi:mycothiol synthase
MPQNNPRDIDVPDAPDIPGLAFRMFQGKQDYPAIVNVLEGCKEADQFELTTTVESVARSFKHLHNCDPYKDMLFVEMNGKVIGYTQVWWMEEPEGTRNYIHFAALLPEWRGKGIRRSMLLFNECRAREIAAEHPEGSPHFFQAWADDTELHWISLLRHEHYNPVRYYFTMIRSLVEPVPDLPLPEGFETRPVEPDDYWTIWRAADEALQDHWGGSDLTDEILEEWMERPDFNPGLWVTAWDTATKQVAGVVLSSIDEEENQEYNRKRAHVGPIGVRRPHRRKGLASALIARSLQVLKDSGMGEAVLNADSENPTGALRLYEKMGFSTAKQFTTYRKPMNPE